MKVPIASQAPLSPGILLFGCLCACLICGHAAPLNDSFTNRFLLSGASETLAGTLVGATAEPGEGSSSPSLWWTWTAPASGPLMISNEDPFSRPRLLVTTSTDPGSILSRENHVVEDVPPPKNALSFNALAGTRYQIGIFYTSGASNYTLHVQLTNFPVILAGPRPQAISPGSSTLFAVSIAAGPQVEQTIAWQFNGETIPGETGPTLAITNATPDHAGEYRAVITAADISGQSTTRITEPARLEVTAPARPLLSIISSDQSHGAWYITTTTEPGRSYNLDWSSDLLTGESSYMAFASSALPLLVLDPRSGYKATQIYRLSNYEPPNPICHLNLQRIHFAKHRLAVDTGMKNGDTISETDVNHYLHVDTLKCPDGGFYTYGSIGAYPTCSLAAQAGHILEYQ